MTDAFSGAKFRWHTAGCIVLILMGLAHLAAQLADTPTATHPDEAELLRLMGSYQIPLPGGSRTMQSIMDGFGYFFTCASAAMGVAGLAVARVRPRTPGAVRAIDVVYAVSCAALTVVSLKFWFVIPTSFLAASTVLFGIAALRDGRVALSGETGANP